MLVDNARWIALLRLAVIFGLAGCGIAAAEEVPELEFLEYLGSWEESDEDWLLFNQAESEQVRMDDERSDPAPTGEESTENDDES
jgi:hypothetical protein